jgi:hypothetical protein
MLPTKSNHTKDGCVTTSSNCVIWQGPDLTCINLCKGDTVSDVVAKLATELCDLMDEANISNYDLSCLDLPSDPTNSTQLIQIIVNRICSIENEIDSINSGGGGGTSSGCPDDCNLTLPDCLRYTNPATGGLVTSTSLTNFVQLLGNRICTIISEIDIINNSIDQINETIIDLTDRVEILESGSTNPNPGAQSNVDIQCINNQTSTPINTAVQTIASQFCNLINFGTGTTSEISAALLKQCTGLSSSNQLSGPNGAVMSQLSGWVGSPENIADSLTNLWLTICDIRSSLQNVLTNCCDTICGSIYIEMTITSDIISNILTISFSGTIPSSLQETPIGLGTTFTLTQSGLTGTNTFTIPVTNYINGPDYSYTIPSGLNLNQPFIISGSFTASDTVSGESCSFAIIGTYSSTAECPTITETITASSITIQFVPYSATTTYVVELLDYNTQLVLQTVNAPNNGTLISVPISGLSVGTQYKYRVKYDPNGGTNYTVCSIVQFTTSIPSCISGVSAEAEVQITIN